MLRRAEIQTCPELMQLIERIGFLPLLDSGIVGFTAEELVDEDCRYVQLPEGGWDWPLWKWKGPIVTEGNCVYGKFFDKKAGFVSRAWWPELYNYRRSVAPAIQPGSVEETILLTLREHGSMITRELRAQCGFTGAKMRSRFDAYVTRLQMACRIVTADFIYPRDRHGSPYGWGWALLTTPEDLYGDAACRSEHTPEESYRLIINHLTEIVPNADTAQLERLIRL